MDTMTDHNTRLCFQWGCTVSNRLRTRIYTVSESWCPQSHWLQSHTSVKTFSHNVFTKATAQPIKASLDDDPSCCERRVVVAPWDAKHSCSCVLETLCSDNQNLPHTSLAGEEAVRLLSRRPARRHLSKGLCFLGRSRGRFPNPFCQHSGSYLNFIWVLTAVWVGFLCVRGLLLLD